MATPANPERSGRASPWRVLAIGAFILVSFVAVALWIWCAGARLAYPFELSKWEGLFADHARWAAAGRPTYLAPSAEFVPFLYMPLAHHVAGWLVSAGQSGFLATRLVSLVGVVGATAIAMALARRAAARPHLCWLVPLLVAARYFDVECFYDQARPDNLMTLFLLAATFALALPSARIAVVLFALAGTLAFFSKQSALFFLATLLALQLLVRWRVALAAGGLLAAIAAPLFFWLDAQSGGWLETYTFTIPANHWIDWHGLAALSASEFLVSFAVVTLLLAAASFVLVRAVVRRAPARRDARELAWHAALSGALGGALFSFASSSQPLAVRNVYVIFAIASAPFVLLALERAINGFLPRARQPAGWTAAWFLLALNGALGLRDPRPFRPTTTDAQVWRDLAAKLATLGPPERTWVTLHAGSWGCRRGDPFHLHLGALSDLMGGYFGAASGIAIPADLAQRITERWYTAIVIGDWDPRIKPLIADHYEPAPDLAPIRLPMLSGYPAGKSVIWVPKKG